MSMYVFAPAGPRELRNNLLRVAIEYIYRYVSTRSRRD